MIDPELVPTAVGLRRIVTVRDCTPIGVAKLPPVT
jgi:hypothetical protein